MIHTSLKVRLLFHFWNTLFKVFSFVTEPFVFTYEFIHEFLFIVKQQKYGHGRYIGKDYTFKQIAVMSFDWACSTVNERW